VRTSLLATFYSLSGDAAPNERWRYAFERGKKFLDSVVVPEESPPWLNEADLDFFTASSSARFSRRAQLVSQHRSQTGS